MIRQLLKCTEWALKLSTGATIVSLEIRLQLYGRVEKLVGILAHVCGSCERERLLEA